MKYFRFLLFFAVLFSLSEATELTAQIVNPPTSYCVDFEYACGGAAAFFPNGQISVSCDRSTRTYNIPEPGDEFCFAGTTCNKGTNTACLRYKNWHFCNSNSGSVYQSLPRNSSINGSVLGNYPFEGSTGGVSACVGRIYSEFNNNIFSATEIARCPGDPAILTVPDLEFPTGYNGRLGVNITTTSGTPVANGDYGNGDINASYEIDITSIIDGLPEGFYIIELRLKCDGQLSSCPGGLPNRVKKTYIEIIEDNFRANYRYAVQGNIFDPTCPEPVGLLGDDPDGPVIELESCNPSYQLTITDIENAGGQGISITVLSKDCSSPGPFNELVTINRDASEVASGSVSIGTISNPGVPANECICYKIDVTFFDICIDALNTTSKYYRVGSDCPEGFTDPGNIKKGKAQNGGSTFRIYPNPIENYINIRAREFEGDEFSLIIYNNSGQIVQQVDIQNSGGVNYRQPVDLPAGAYYYNIVWQDGTQSGTFVKQ